MTAAFFPLTSTPKAHSLLSGIEPLDMDESEDAARLAF